MKHQKTRILLGIAATGVLLFTMDAGCTKNNTNTNSNTIVPTKGQVSAMVAGTAFQSQYTFGSFTIMTGVIKMDGLQLNQGDTTELSVYFPDTVQLNQAVALGPGCLIYFSDWTSGAIYGAGLFSRQLGYGAITVTAWDSVGHTVSGSFSGVLQSPATNDTIVVSNGQFSGSYNVVP